MKGLKYMRNILALLVGCLVGAAVGTAAVGQCVGTNLIEALPQDSRARIEAAVADVPYHRGLLWQARRGDAVITLVGTYHFADPRHQRMMDRLEDILPDAQALYVEAGPKEEARLTRALSDDPTLMVATEGPTLPERLSPEEWQILSNAMADRGTPSVMTAKLRPWYVALMLGVSPCMLNAAQAGDIAGGLDHLLTDRAGELGVPVRALEPWDTVFTLFADLTPEQELDMIRASLTAASYADDYAVTLTDAYFGGDVWTIWEFGRFDAYQNSGLSKEAVDQQMEFAQTQLMDQRNENWIAPLEQGADRAARAGKGIVAGFGALHLPGKHGVLRLLEDRGWQIRRLDG